MTPEDIEARLTSPQRRQPEDENETISKPAQIRFKRKCFLNLNNCFMILELENERRKEVSF